MGPGVLPVLVQLYRTSGESGRTAIAESLYGLGWKSAEAKQVLMQDVHTRNPDLRLQVQWALGRVSADPDVVEVLLDNMMNDANPLFRDKAACALAYDQVHLSERQKVRLFEGLIQGLSDGKSDVRSIAVLALSIQTGQTKGFDANAAPEKREAAIREWKKWLDDYRSRW
jgi:HEAT repeat protein